MTESGTWREAAGIRFPPSLEAGREDDAVKILGRYYATLSGKNDGYTGGAWDTFDPSRTRASSANTFTADDLLSLALLSVRVPGRAAVELLDRQRRRFEVLLEDLGPDREFVDEPSVARESFEPAWVLSEALRVLPDVGATTAAKLLARKRPRLIPVYDKVIRDNVFPPSGVQWVPLHAALNADGQRLHHRLIDIRRRAGLSEAVSALRVFDVLAWMEATGNAKRDFPKEPTPDDLEKAMAHNRAVRHAFEAGTLRRSIATPKGAVALGRPFVDWHRAHVFTP